jgi:hypothetical protein
MPAPAGKSVAILAKPDEQQRNARLCRVTLGILSKPREAIAGAAHRRSSRLATPVMMKNGRARRIDRLRDSRDAIMRPAGGDTPTPPWTIALK